MTDPPVPDQPAYKGCEATPSGDGDGGHALLKYADEAGDEYGHGTHLLQYDGGVGDERPEFVGLETGIALQVFQEGRLIGVIIGV